MSRTALLAPPAPPRPSASAPITRLDQEHAIDDLAGRFLAADNHPTIGDPDGERAYETLLHLVRAYSGRSYEECAAGIEDLLDAKRAMAAFADNPDVIAVVGEYGSYDQAEQTLAARVDAAIAYCLGGSA